MHLLATFDKQPGDQLDYDIDYYRWMPEGDAITSADAVVQVGSIQVMSVQILTPLTVKVWVSGGEDGETASISVRAGTQGGRIKDVDFALRIRGGAHGSAVR